MVNHQLITFFCSLFFLHFFFIGFPFYHRTIQLNFNRKSNLIKNKTFFGFLLLHSVRSVIRSLVRFVHSFYVFNSVTQVCIGRVFNGGASHWNCRERWTNTAQLHFNIRLTIVAGNVIVEYTIVTGNDDQCWQRRKQPECCYTKHVSQFTALDHGLLE